MSSERSERLSSASTVGDAGRTSSPRAGAAELAGAAASRRAARRRAAASATWHVPCVSCRPASPETAPKALERMTSRRTRASGPRSSQVAADMVLAISRGLRGRWVKGAKASGARCGRRGPPRRRDFAQGLCGDPCGRRGRANSSSVCFFSRANGFCQGQGLVKTGSASIFFLDPCCGLNPCRGDV